jgi:hypothetical protein
MIYVLAALAGIVGALAGWLLTGFGIVVLSTMLGVPSADQAAAAFATLGPFGGLAGLAIGVLLVLRFKGGVRAPRDLAKRAGFTVLIVAVLAAGMLRLADSALANLGINARPPAIAFEIRLPLQAASAPLMQSEAQVTLNTDLNETVAQLAPDWALTDDGRPVIAGSVSLPARTVQRMIALSLPGQPSRLFRLRLAPKPSPSDTFSPWHQVDFIDNGAAPLERARPDAGYAIRYRVF